MMRATLVFVCLFKAAIVHGQLLVSPSNFSHVSASASKQTMYASKHFFAFQQIASSGTHYKHGLFANFNPKRNTTTEFLGNPTPLFYLQSSTNSKKTLQLKRSKITLFIDESNSFAPAQISKFNTTECLLDSINGDSVIVTLLSEEIDIDYRNKYTNITNSYFGGSFNKVQKSIALKNIVYIQTRNPLRSNLSKAGTVLMGAAIVLIVSSPFAGIRQQGDARIAARERVFSTGLACFAASVPLFIFGKPKKYHVSSNYKSRKNAHWYLLQH